jgi:uncharacterized protein (TIGR02996 family)
MADPLASLLQQVTEHLDDDRPRRVYADALSQQGDPRGELIAVQCALETAKGSELARLKGREKALLEAHRAEWFGWLEKFLRELMPYDVSKYVVRRGFLEHVQVTPEQPERDLAFLGTRAPTLISLTVRGAWAPVPWLARLRRIEANELETLVPVLALTKGLRALHVDGIDASDEACAALVGALAQLPALERLVLNQFGPSLTPGPLPSLQALDVEHSEWGQGHVQGWLKAAPKSLARLSLRRAPLDEGDTAALVERFARSLTHLALDWAKPAPKALPALLSARWERLESLELTNFNVGPNGAALLAGLGAPKLSVLDLQNARLGDAGVEALAGSQLFSKLRALSLRANKLSAVALKALSKGTHQLKQLNLNKNGLDKTAVQRLKALAGFKSTRVLS